MFDLSLPSCSLTSRKEVADGGARSRPPLLQQIAEHRSMKRTDLFPKMNLLSSLNREVVGLPSPCLLLSIELTISATVLSHIIAQLRPGADLSRVVLPTFILEPRSMLERITKYVLFFFSRCASWLALC